MSTRAPSFSAPFIATLQASSADLEWRRSYGERQVSKQFWNNYCWTEIFGHLGPRPSEHLSCGALILGAEVHYPSHRHEADEIYIPLVGNALWLESGRWQRKPPGAVIHHLPNQVHAMRTQAEPLLALYLWKSDNLDQKAELIGSR
jgi:quercetin dioxygenase-like cupin family protein